MKKNPTELKKHTTKPRPKATTGKVPEKFIGKYLTKDKETKKSNEECEETKKQKTKKNRSEKRHKYYLVAGEKLYVCIMYICATTRSGEAPSLGKIGRNNPPRCSPAVWRVGTLNSTAVAVI